MQMEAALSVARELALEAIADKLGIEVSDDEVKALIREQAEAAGEDADEVIEDLWQHGRQEDCARSAARGARPGRRRGEADPARAGAGARRDLDADKESPEQRQSCGPLATDVTRKETA